MVLPTSFAGEVSDCVIGARARVFLLMGSPLVPRRHARDPTAPGSKNLYQEGRQAAVAAGNDETLTAGVGPVEARLHHGAQTINGLRRYKGALLFKVGSLRANATTNSLSKRLIIYH